MADEEKKQPQHRTSLPPISSSKAVSGSSQPSLPPLKSGAKPAGSVAASAPKPVPSTAPPKEEASPIASASELVESTKSLKSPVQSVPAKAPAIRKPKQDRPPEDDAGIWRMSRKNFLHVAGWAAFFSFLVTATVGAIRLMVPRVLYESPSAFKAGFPTDYVVGEVNETYKDEFRVWIIREEEGFYALAAICTHLGCTPRWSASENKFKCPCHGSGYYKDGVNFEGPTPRPLERLKITLSDDGQILVDRNIKFLHEKQEWGKPDSFLKYS